MSTAWYIEETISTRAELDTIGTGRFFEIDLHWSMRYPQDILIETITRWIARGCGGYDETIPTFSVRVR